jgi:coenzyme F420-reducing hydrogenase delta subunit
MRGEVIKMPAEQDYFALLKEATDELKMIDPEELADEVATAADLDRILQTINEMKAHLERLRDHVERRS